MIVRWMALFSLLLLPGAANAQMAPATCETVGDANLPADLAGWAGPRAALVAAATGEAPLLPLGRPVALMLHPAAHVTLPHPPGQVRTPENVHAGFVRVLLPAAGVWRISLSTAPWVDFLAGDAPLKSGAHGMLAPCTGIRKVVEFEAAAGEHRLQLSGNPGAAVTVMISRKP